MVEECFKDNMNNWNSVGKFLLLTILPFFDSGMDIIPKRDMGDFLILLSKTCKDLPMKVIQDLLDMGFLLPLLKSLRHHDIEDFECESNNLRTKENSECLNNFILQIRTKEQFHEITHKKHLDFLQVLFEKKTCDWSTLRILCEKAEELELMHDFQHEIQEYNIIHTFLRTLRSFGEMQNIRKRFPGLFSKVNEK